jgi:tetratricopeptide (TPR) repeat protein
MSASGKKAEVLGSVHTPICGTNNRHNKLYRIKSDLRRAGGRLVAVGHVMRQRAVLLLEKFAQRNPSDPVMSFWDVELPNDEHEQAELAEAFDRLGVELFNGGDAQQALEAFWPNFLLRLRIVQRNPADRGAIRDFASAEDLMGLAFIELDKLALAEQMLSEALTYRRGLFQDDPSDAHAAYLYGAALNHMGRLDHAKGNAVPALDYFRQARDHLFEVDKMWSGVSFIEIELAEAVESLRAIGEDHP